MSIIPVAVPIAAIHAHANNRARRQAFDTHPQPDDSFNRSSQHPEEIEIFVLRHSPAAPTIAVPEPAHLPPSNTSRPGCSSAIKNLFAKQQQKKAAKKAEKTALKQARQQASENAKAQEQQLGHYFKTVLAFRDQLLGEGANPVIHPESIHTEPDETLIGQYPINRVQAKLNARNQQYHVAFSEIRKADPNRTSSFAYGKPVKEQDKNPSFPEGTLLEIEITGPGPERFTFERWPQPEIKDAVWGKYTDQDGNRVERSYAYLNHSGQTRDIRKGDRQIQDAFAKRLQTLVHAASRPSRQN